MNRLIIFSPVASFFTKMEKFPDFPDITRPFPDNNEDFEDDEEEE